MKKVLIITLLTLLSMTKINAQTMLGGGIMLGSDATAIEGKADFVMSENISISPSFDYFLIDDSSYSVIMIGADGHYNFGDPATLNYYPLVGLNYFSVSYSGDGYSFSYGSGIGLTIGGGATYALSEKLKLYGELKYLRSSMGLSAGVMFSL